MLFSRLAARNHDARRPAISSWFGVGVMAVSVALGTAGCGQSGDGAGDASGSETAAGRHSLTGVIVSVSAERGTLLVQHEDIPGVMPAMTMEFHAPAAEVAKARAGQRIRAQMYQAPDGFYLEGIWPVEEAKDRVVSEAARLLRQDTVTRGAGAYREVGENLPDFALYNQDGEVVSPARFRGRQIMLNFIFTRCPDPNMCPAATARMAGLQKMARAAGVNNLELISVTLDPEFDTPAILHDYAEGRGIDTSNFSFLTGPEGAIKDLLAQLGVLTFQNGPLVTHTLATVLIDENGKIVHRVDGSTWDANDFLARMHRPPEARATGDKTSS